MEPPTFADVRTDSFVSLGSMYESKPGFYVLAGPNWNGDARYAVTFAKGEPPVAGFWSLTLYDTQHFFVPNAINRFSIGTKNKDLKANTDGSLTIYVQAAEPIDPEQRTNWLPAPRDKDFSLFIRAYWPGEAILNGGWTPPGVVAMGKK